MAKFHLKKKSKRQPARLRYKIEKKIRDHNRKLRKDAKKNPTKKRKTLIQVPNICPFKENILKDVEAMKKQNEEEKKQQRETARLEKQKQFEEKKKLKLQGGLEGLVANAEARSKLHEHISIENEEKVYNKNSEKSLKQYYKEFRKVIEAADIILEVLDARDPLGTRCLQVEQAVNDMKGKKLVLVLNKSDLIPREILDKWLKFLRKTAPVVAFKASTQMQNKKLGQIKFSKSEKIMQNSSTIGADLLMSLLANYCRNKDIKTSITVGIVGLPNVGKSSIINSLKRSRACNVGATPGVTRAMQEVQLDSKIKLLDSPGIVFAKGNDNTVSLKNAVRISGLSDPITPANSILQRVSKHQMMEIYDITEYNSPEEFYYLKAKRTGRLKKGGVPDIAIAARGLLEDWNNGKIKYYTVPPEVDESAVHISSEIVTSIAKEFNLDEFESMETEVLNKIEKEYGTVKNAFVIESTGPIESVEQMEQDQEEPELLGDNVNVLDSKKKTKKTETTKKKIDPEMELEGNQQLNQIRKKQFKKEKKQRNRREKISLQLSAGLENFCLNSDNVTTKDDDYDFKTDFMPK